MLCLSGFELFSRWVSLSICIATSALACEQQTHFRSSLLSLLLLLLLLFSEGEKRRPEMRLLFAGYLSSDFTIKSETIITNRLCGSPMELVTEVDREDPGFK